MMNEDRLYIIYNSLRGKCQESVSSDIRIKSITDFVEKATNEELIYVINECDRMIKKHNVNKISFFSVYYIRDTLAMFGIT